MGLQRSCIDLANRPSFLLRPSCCRSAFPGENFIQSGHRRLSLIVAQYRRIDGIGSERGGTVGVIGLGANSLPPSRRAAHSAALQPRQRRRSAVKYDAALDVSPSKSAVCEYVSHR
jgi:hypothetical protein